MKNILFYFVFSSLLIYSCSDSNSIPETDQRSGDNSDNPTDDNDGTGGGNDDVSNTNTWLIDKSLVFDGGPGKDGIPALINPELITVSQDNYLLDDDLVIGLKHGDKVIAYPHKILDWHEIINADIDDLSIAITYCPLTGTAVGWDRNINNTKTTFGVSGLLYKNNLIPYDRLTDSNWSQLKLECVNGKLIGNKPEITVLPEMNWGLWKKIYPQTKVVSTNTGFQRTYSRYPYGDYKSNNQYFIFPVDPIQNNIPAKERVHTIIKNDVAKVYRFQNLDNGKVIIDTFQNHKFLIVGNQDFILSFQLDETTNTLEFKYDFNDTEIILSDNERNTWNLFGEAISGPKKGTFLKPAESSMMAYYFSIEAFYTDPNIYN